MLHRFLRHHIWGYTICICAIKKTKKKQKQKKKTKKKQKKNKQTQAYLRETFCPCMTKT